MFHSVTCPGKHTKQIHREFIVLQLAMASFYEDGDAEPQVVEVDDDDEDIQETAAPSSGDGGGRSQSAGQSGGGSR